MAATLLHDQTTWIAVTAVIALVALVVGQLQQASNMKWRRKYGEAGFDYIGLGRLHPSDDFDQEAPFCQRVRVATNRDWPIREATLTFEIDGRLVREYPFDLAAREEKWLSIIVADDLLRKDETGRECGILGCVTLRASAPGVKTIRRIINQSK